MCPAGKRSRVTEFRSTSCLPCNEETFTDRPNGKTRCNQCSTCDPGGLSYHITEVWGDLVKAEQKFYFCLFPGSGLKLKRKCEPSSDTVCEPMEGFFCIEPTNTGCSAAQRHKSCEELNLRLITAGTAAADAQCGGKRSNETAVWFGIRTPLFVILCIASFISVFALTAQLVPQLNGLETKTLDWLINYGKNESSLSFKMFGILK
uniref:TNFR-Cys domain-containing protein n=1 Tax=Kryptolebias marmoratus TaxID=37003 RepID=A0A3Q3ADU4_KRYMA